MTKEQEMVREFMQAAKQVTTGVPRIPTEPERELRANLILEEALELIEALGFDVTIGVRGQLKLLRTEMEGLPNLELIADGLADLHYVAYCGTGLCCGIDMEPVFAEVHRSNMSKFIDGTFRADGKYIKGPNYSKPNLKPLLGL